MNLDRLGKNELSINLHEKREDLLSVNLWSVEVIASQENVTLSVLPRCFFRRLYPTIPCISDIHTGAMRISISRVINLERLEIARLTQ